jgi:succinate dehydrogenase/fumarate reductase flavoprotein subunit
MRALPMAILVLGAVLAGAGLVRAAEPDDGSPKDDVVREQLEALDDLEHAETDEDADAAAERFDDANRRDLERRRQAIDRLIEK